MFYDETDIGEIIKQYDIVKVISKSVQLIKIGKKYFGKCPLHNDEAESFMVDPETQKFCCFGCGCGGNVINFIMQYHHTSFLRALKMLDSNVKYRKNIGNQERNRILEVNETVSKIYQEQRGEAAAAEYIKKRGLSDETIEKFGIGYSFPKGRKLYDLLKAHGYSNKEIMAAKIVGFYDNNYIQDKFYDRLMFPIQNVEGNVIGFGGRILTDSKDQPKYINSSESQIYNKSYNLFGLNFAKDSKQDYFIACEGYMDVISLHQYDFTNAVASLGTALTKQQISLLSTYKKKIYLAYDSDAPGVVAAKRAISIIGDLMEIKLIDMNPYKDPDEFLKALGTEEYQKRIDSASSPDEWVLKQLGNDALRNSANAEAIRTELLEMLY